jgi:dihydrofolate reductase
VTVKLIIAVDQGNAIGWSDGKLAYTGLKQDMKRFKELTTGSTVFMGFNTFKSLGRPNGLPNRKNVVLTRKKRLEVQEHTQSDNVTITHSLEYLKHADSDVWIIGGKSVYEAALRQDLVDEMHVTLISAQCEADVVMDTDLAAWKLFIIRNPQWRAELGSSQWDGDFQTTYLTLTKTS